MIRAWLAAWRERRARIRREADLLHTWMGERAFDAARQRGREARARGDRADGRLWSAVAVELGRRTGREPGLNASDRYEDEAPDPAGDARRRANLVTVRDTHAALSDIALGRNDGMVVHNIGAHVRLAVLRVRTERARQAGEELFRAAEALAGDRYRCEAALRARVYPPALIEAPRALERFRRTLG